MTRRAMDDAGTPTTAPGAADVCLDAGVHIETGPHKHAIQQTFFPYGTDSRESAGGRESTSGRKSTNGRENTSEPESTDGRERKNVLSLGTGRIAVLGLGEAGSEIARDLVTAGASVCGFDPLLAPPAGVDGRSSDADAVRDADLVLSVNSSHDAVPALLAALGALRPGTIWADLNTAAPSVKETLASLAAPREVGVVDVALMSPVPGKGLRTPMLVSGSAVRGFSEMLTPLGAVITVQDGPAGAAIGRKLLRSVFYKGLAAAVVEALAAAEAAGCGDWLRGNISAELAGFDERTIERLVDGTHRHARRRADEMAAATEQLRSLGVEPRIAAAARDLLIELSQPDEGEAK
ncbi:DUF1932 domain-containing protein [Actinoplanes sp. NPDC089786]|uniref:DUF1932 domain-containing protein n=1 Tax=Actinoplanes sp. NPDC089786 TaxID=3155185 RepID=UPI003429858F